MNIYLTKKVFKSLIALGLLGFNVSTFAAGQLVVSPIRESVEGLQKKEIRLENKGDQTMYIEVSMSLIDDPNLNADQQKRTKITNIQSPELMPNLSKLTLGPGQSRVLDLTPLKVPLQEKVYILYAIPVSGIKVEGEAEDSVKAPINIAVGYGAVIYHQPTANLQKKTWKYTCLPEGIHFTATGNTHNTFTGLSTTVEGKLDKQFNVFPGAGKTIPFKKLKGQADGNSFEISCP